VTRETSVRVPRATYRVQFGPDLSFAEVATLAGHLATLGVTDVYASPILAPVPGAEHGYHVVDPHRVDERLGGREGLEELRRTLDEHGLSLLLDIVPNHLAAHHANPWWWDVLAHGPSSAHASYFDIDWEGGDGRIVLPVLGAELDVVLDRGELQVIEEAGEPRLAYHDARFPLAPATRDRATTVRAAHDPGALRSLIDEQHYTLTYWRTGDPNYRRFFDITDLIGVRVELPDVFADRHALILELLYEGVIEGLRVDHVDGLRDPLGYLRDLRRAAGGRAYIVVEKIVEGDEPLPEEWPVEGTTGYELASAITAVQVDPDGFAALDSAYRGFTGRTASAEETVQERKVAALRELLRPEVEGLTRRLADLAARTRELPDVGHEDVRDALVAVTAAFPVYRTYTHDRTIRPHDREHLETAFAAVRGTVDGRALDLLERVLLVDLPEDLADDLRDGWLDIVMRWQQLTGPAMAKGFEDTTFYVHNRLIALNEVGADAHGLDHPHGVDGFHERVARRAASWPNAMNATSTHDTKRSEDVRARIAVLSEVPDRWVDTVQRWHERTAGLRSEVAGHPAPDPNEEWLLYQTLVGMWPLEAGEEPTVTARLGDYAVKAAREAKVNTSWLGPDADHEAALRRFVEGLTTDAVVIEDLHRLLDRVALPGACNSLAQLTVKLLAPGVPDIYQGTELWDWSLVDPDNRRPVDHALRRRSLTDVARSYEQDPLVTIREVRDTWWDGRIKLLVLWRLLALRRERSLAGYSPLETHGEHAHRLVAFSRRTTDGWVVAVVPRHVTALTAEGRWPTGDVWGDTVIVLPDGRPTDWLTGRRVEGDRVRVADVLDRLPIAALVSS
jgi:(1->4)-alpha-D-glucan 1-alpha-D-glucosylmutase